MQSAAAFLSLLPRAAAARGRRLATSVRHPTYTRPGAALRTHTHTRTVPRAMTTLSAANSCVGCEGLTDVLTRDELATHMLVIPEWQVSDDAKSITLDFRVRNFQAALDYLNAVGALAEIEGHHPDMTVHSYNHVRLVLSTHALGGLTTNDIILAAKIDCVPVEKRPPRKKKAEKEQQQ